MGLLNINWIARRSGLVLMGILAGSTACSQKQAPPPGAPASGAAVGATGSNRAAAGPGAAGGRRGGGAAAVTTYTVATTLLRDETEALGTAKANEAVDITAKATNRVVAMHIREGQFARKGDVLVEFDGNEARANLAAAVALTRDTQSQFQRSRTLFQSKALSESDMVQVEAKMLNSKSAVEAAQARVDDTVIRAPFAGRMGLRIVSVGSLVTPGQVITTLDDISVIKLDFSVPEGFIATIKEGDLLDAHCSAYPDEVFKGRVNSIATRVDPVSRSIVVRALIDNRNLRLKPGMFMTVKLQRTSREVMMIPEQALTPENDNQFVYVLHGDTARKVEVHLGRRKPGQVEVVDGLKVGDLVVVEGGDNLRDGAKVKARPAEAEAASS